MAQKYEGLAMGIDLGTTYSCVGVWLSGRVEIIPNEMGHKKTPSYVAFSDTRRLLGEEAKNHVALNPTNTIFNIKRLMGRRWYDKFLIRDMSKLWPFKVEYDPENYRCMVLVNYKGKEKLFSPEEISSMILIKMREIAEAYLGATIRNAVISVPAHFNTAQRQATMDAGVIAGLNVMRLINEPSSAALAYGFDRNVGREGKKNVIIFDLGGGTLDVSLLKIGWGTFKVMSTAGDAYLGGEDFEETIVNHCIEEFKKKHSVDIGGNFRAVRRLKAACEKAKIVLSVTNQATIEIDCLYEEIDFSSTITRAQFVKLSSHLLRKCRETVERCLMEAKVSPRSIDEVLLVGGSTRMPMVQDMLRSYFSKELCKAVNADQAVAYGATLQAAMLTYCEGNEEAPTLVLEDVSPLDLRVLVDRTNQTTMCRKNTAIPPKHGLKIPFHQYMEDSLDVYEDGHLLGTLSGCYNYVIWGHLVIDENGMWSALVLDGNTNQEIKAAIPMGRLNEQEIQRMVQEAEECNFQDKAHKKKVDQEKNSLEKFVYDVRQAISDKKMEDKPQKNIEAAIEKVIEWLSSIPLIELKDCKEKMVELHAVHQPILSKNHKEAEKENNDSSPYGDAAPSASANDVHSSSCVVCKPKAVQAHSDNITESNFASSISGGASGTVESKIICHPKIDAKKVSHGREAGLEFAVAKSYFSDGTTSKLEIRFPNSDSKVEITSEMKVMTNFNHLDRSHLHRILSEVGRWAHDMGLDTYNQISCMLNAKIESNNSSTGDGADSASDGLSPLC